jgi:hypothetical protein
MSALCKLASVAFVLCICMSAITPAATAQMREPVTTLQPDDLCDYCKDFTDAAVTGGPVRSAYRPGEGYATEGEHGTASVEPGDRQQSGVRMVGHHAAPNPN